MQNEGLYQGSAFVTCRRCVQLGIYPDRAIVAVVGATVEGDDCLSCGHVQDPGDKVQKQFASRAEQRRAEFLKKERL